MIKENLFVKHGIKPKYHKPILLEKKIMTTTQLQSKKTDGLIKRVKDGKEYFVTPAENFRNDTNYRLSLIKDQIKRLGKQTGKNFEHTPEQLNDIENYICTWLTEMRENLENSGKKAVKTEQFI